MSAAGTRLADRARLRCQDDPDRWFQAAHRVTALRGCLRCPARRWCARQALIHRPSAGMWAGIWIDGVLDDTAAGYLQAIAATPTGATIDHTDGSPSTVSPPPAQAALPQPTDVAKHRDLSRIATSAAVAARSSGHCEIMAPGCRLSFDQLASRLRGGPAGPEHSTATAFAVCRCCAVVLDDLHPGVAQRLGYLVGTEPAAASAPFYWRQSRWVLLDTGGNLSPAAEAA